MRLANYEKVICQFCGEKAEMISPVDDPYICENCSEKCFSKMINRAKIMEK